MALNLQKGKLLDGEGRLRLYLRFQRQSTLEIVPTRRRKLPSVGYKRLVFG